MLAATSLVRRQWLGLGSQNKESVPLTPSPCPGQDKALQTSRLLFDWTWESLSLSDSLQAHGLYSPWNSPDQNTGLGSLFLLQGIFPTQGSNPSLPYCRRILYQLSHKGSPTILEWVAYPFSSGSSQPRNQTGVSYIAGGFFTNFENAKEFLNFDKLNLSFLFFFLILNFWYHS